MQWILSRVCNNEVTNCRTICVKSRNLMNLLHRLHRWTGTQRRPSLESNVGQEEVEVTSLCYYTLRDGNICITPRTKTKMEQVLHKSICSEMNWWQHSEINKIVEISTHRSTAWQWWQHLYLNSEINWVWRNLVATLVKKPSQQETINWVWRNFMEKRRKD